MQPLVNFSHYLQMATFTLYIAVLFTLNNFDCVGSFHIWRKFDLKQPKISRKLQFYPQRVVSASGAVNELEKEPNLTYFNTLTNTYDFKPLWDTIKSEATDKSYDDRKASSFMSNAILSERTLDDVVIDHVSNQLESTYLQATQVRNLFSNIRHEHTNISTLWALDLIACTTRDKFSNTVNTLLFSKGYHALVTHRVASALWYSGREDLARYLQSTASRVFGADIHPACRIGKGCYLSTASGAVIGETSVIGDDCSIAHAVTLGGTGKEGGDRHPKLGNGVYLSSGCIILGNIILGDGCVVDHGSVVTKEVRPGQRVGGVPAKAVNEVVLSNRSDGSVAN